MLGAWVAYVADRWIPGSALSVPAFAVVGMAAVFAGTAREPIATLVMVAEMTGGYGLIVPSMFATILAFVVERALTVRFQYPRLTRLKSSSDIWSCGTHDEHAESGVCGFGGGSLGRSRSS